MCEVHGRQMQRWFEVMKLYRDARPRGKRTWKLYRRRNLRSFRYENVSMLEELAAAPSRLVIEVSAEARAEDSRHGRHSGLGPFPRPCRRQRKPVRCRTPAWFKVPDIYSCRWRNLWAASQRLV